MSAALLMTACSGGGGESDGADEGGEQVGAESDSGGLATTCGTVFDGTVRNPIDSERGVQVQLVSVLDSNAVVVSDGEEQLLVKLQGIGGTTGFSNTAAVDLFTGLAAQPLYFFRAGDCTGTVIGGRTATVGSIVTEGGASFAEQAIAAKYAGVIESTGSCGEDALAGCFATIAASNEHHVYEELEECTTMPGYIRYRPADTDCGGNASVVIDNDRFGDVFSVQLRYPDGTDRIIESCESAGCTPLKVQDYIRTDSLTVACFGAPGNAVALSDINHVSIKREGDDHEPPRFCIADPNVPLN